MKIQPMSFKNYIWPFNPSKIEVEYSRNINKLKLPLYGSILQDLGCDKRVVTGSGEFIGNGCTSEFNKLAEVFNSGGSGTLCLPYISPFTAAFVSLKMVGEAQPDCISYKFIFIEDEDEKSKQSDYLLGTGFYVCKGGENLWGVANMFHTDADTLKSLNPMIEWPNYLEKGTKVVLP